MVGGASDPIFRRVLNAAWLRPLIFLSLLFGLWDVAIRIFQIPPYQIPAPKTVIVSLWTEWTDLLAEAWPTTVATVEGFLLSAIFGISVAVLIAGSRTVEAYVYPLLVFSQSIPKIAIAPLFVVWFGFGLEGKIFITAIITFFPVLVNMMAGYQAVEPERIELARSCNASEWHLLTKIIIPSCLPFLFAGLGVASVLSILGAVVGEFVGASAGLGMLLMQYNQSMEIAPLFAVIVLLAVIGFLMNYVVSLFERRYCFWAQRTTATARP